MPNRRAVFYFNWCRFHYQPDKLCFRWNCRRFECREARRRVTESLIRLGAQQRATSQTLWFITVYPNTNEPNGEGYPFDFLDRVKTLIDSLRNRAKRRDVEFEYVRVNALKSQNAKSPFQLHTHIIATWLPAPVHRPTPAHPQHFECPELAKIARCHGVTLWIECIESVEAVAGYLRKNLRSYEPLLRRGKRLSVRFNRFSNSRGWYKPSPVELRKLKNRAADAARRVKASAVNSHIRVFSKSDTKDSADSSR